MSYKTLILLSLFAFIFSVKMTFADESRGKNEMNGIKYSRFKNFEKKWKLVTVRYRKDTEEMRFTYANALAYKTLKAGKVVYPDGAIFGKVGVKTKADSLFESSVVPNGARRYQLMVHDNKKYKDQHGWGYALFNEDGITFPEDLKVQTNGCASCHEVAEERGYVFSEEVNLSDIKKSKKISQSKIKFNDISRDELSEKVKSLIPSSFKSVRIIEGKLAENIFQGTLEEIRPFLYKETKNTQLPSILLSQDKERFSLVIPVEIGSNCTSESKNGIYLKSVVTNFTNQGTVELDLCYAP